jgi:2-polyprenyl-3-methyl-5-hydroxy-6-metoxy-1,4-benzoquinol methylase
MDRTPASETALLDRPRRVGDTVAIGGDYQHRVLTQGPRPQRFWHDTKRWLVARYLQPRSADRVLDVGCGSGVVADFLADLPVRECVAVDGNPAAIAFASARFRRPNLRFEQCLVDELNLPDGYFDVCCCLELIEHIYPDQGKDLLATLHRLTRPGGRLLITTPNYRSLWPLLEWALDRSGKVPHLAGDQHVAPYTHRRLSRLAAVAGWATVRQHTCCTLAPWAAAASWSLAEGIRAAEGRLPFGTILVHLLERPGTESGGHNGTDRVDLAAASTTKGRIRPDQPLWPHRPGRVA